MVDKEKCLRDAGMIGEVNGQLCLSARAVSLLGGVPVEELTRIVNSAENGCAKFSKQMVKDMRRTSKEFQAAVGSSELVDVLYARFVGDA